MWGALLQEAIEVAVILNALRALAPVPPAIRMTAADTDLTRRFRAEHQAIRACAEQLRSAAQTLRQASAMDRVRYAHERLTGGVRPHEDAEESDLYPAVNRILGGTDILYGLHATLRLHTAQEDETYLSLGDAANTTPAGTAGPTRLN